MTANESSLLSHKFKTFLRLFSLSETIQFLHEIRIVTVKMPCGRVTEQFKSTHLKL